VRLKKKILESPKEWGFFYLACGKFFVSRNTDWTNKIWKNNAIYYCGLAVVVTFSKFSGSMTEMNKNIKLWLMYKRFSRRFCVQNEATQTDRFCYSMSATSERNQHSFYTHANADACNCALSYSTRADTTDR